MDAPRSRRTALRRAAREAAWAAGAGVVSVIGAVVALGITPAVLGRRWSAGGDDQILHYTLFRSATQAFPFSVNGALGFPDGLNAFFTAQFDIASAVVVALLGLVIRDGFVLLNVFYLLGFVAVAVAGYAFFRCLGTSPGVAAVVAVVLSLAPYHFLRIGAGHAFLANYWAIPLLGILLLCAGGERTDPFHRWISRASGAARIRRRLLPTVVLPLLIASSGGYYYVFSVIVLGGVLLCGVVASLASGSRLRSVLGRAAPFSVLCAAVAVELVALSADWGGRYAPYFESRGLGESENFAGKVLPLFLPWLGTRIPKLGALTNIYNNATAVIKTTEPPGMPVLAIVGLVLLLVALPLIAMAGARALRATAFGRLVADDRIRVLAVAALWTLLFYVVTGFGIAVALIAGTTVRAWSRLSIVLILLALGAVALLLERIGRRSLRAGALALVGIVVVLDQLAGVGATVPLSPAQDDEMSTFVEDADTALPDGCGVVQLPLKSFPDSGSIGAMGDYDPALPYLYTEGEDLRWSYGSVEGTPGFDVLDDSGDPEAFAASVLRSGACAVSVDTAAYSEQEGAWYDEVTAVSGSLEPITRSASGRWLLFEVDRPGR
ncbi:hypothetical protein [Rathayibacter sp. Leaf294]|uniref:hypothetical protein n=1 Tax=Rathayibacter sp. Leaf294 TaxID=1736326 RepID=UPI0006F4B709|nr:hypothetical protein [Rathayibacter sp. Leaf294]KQP97598.1 hypothetical protein ASF42_18165 [Rathayibacter sp. Leaf294]KQS07270.1 hypothetical protein ASG06_18900 [Rathayibacter sp. Leaf185]